MVWELIKDSPGWRIAGWASLVYAAGWLILSQGNHVGIMSGGPIMLYLGLMAIVAQEPDIAHRCTFFDAALPVDGRQLWVSKMLVLLGMLWLPVLAASVVGFTIMRDPALPLLQSAGGLTVILLFAQGFRIRQFQEPLIAFWITLVLGGGGMIVLGSVFPDAGVLILSAYLGVSGVLFGITWMRVPKSFQSAGEDEAVAKSDRTSKSNPKLVWLKLLRPYYLWLLAFLVGLVWITGGSILMGLIGVVPPIVGTTRKNLQFLFSVPAPFRKLFRAVWSPAPVALAIGYLLSQRLGPPVQRIKLDGREELVAFALALGIVFGWIFLLQLGDWSRLRNIPGALRTPAPFLLPIALAVGWIMIPRNRVWLQYGDPIYYYAVKLMAVLPQNPLLLGLVLMVPVAGIYWLAETSFCETEYSTTHTVREAYLQRG